MDTNYSLADIAAASNAGENAGGNWLVFIILFALIFGWGGNGFGGRGTEQYATTAEVRAGFNQQDTGAQLRGITYGLSDIGYANAMNINQAANGINGNITAVGVAVTNEGRALSAQLAESSCATQRAIDGVNYNLATQSAAIQANSTANTQKVLDAIAQNKIDSLTAKVNELELKNAMCGVVRYPAATTYTAGSSCFGGGGCNCGI